MKSVVFFYTADFKPDKMNEAGKTNLILKEM